MSSFNCPKCGTPCIDTDYGYATGCAHHPADARPTPLQLTAFCRREYGEQLEYAFSCRLQLGVCGLGPELTEEEGMLLTLLVEAWRDSLIR